MDFDLTERQTHWRDRVRNFIEQNVRPNMDVYKSQDAEGDRWKVLQIVEDMKAKSQGAGHLEPVYAAAVWPHPH